jgi:hypothetical protein
MAEKLWLTHGPGLISTILVQPSRRQQAKERSNSFTETRRRVKGAPDEEQILIRDVELFG